jgi:hypothetical protein
MERRGLLMVEAGGGVCVVQDGVESVVRVVFRELAEVNHYCVPQ